MPEHEKDFENHLGGHRGRCGYLNTELPYAIGGTAGSWRVLCRTIAEPYKTPPK